MKELLIFHLKYLLIIVFFYITITILHLQLLQSQLLYIVDLFIIYSRKYKVEIYNRK